MRVSKLFSIKTFLCILLKTSAQCGFAIKCFISCLQFLTGCKAAFYRCISDGELVGSVTAFSESTLPEGWLLCDGSAVSRTAYARLFGVIGTTYGSGDGSTTFNLPNLVDKFIQGNATSGTEKTAGLPNVTGSLLGATTLGVVVDGALGWEQTDSTNYSMTYQSGGMRYGRIKFDASNSNSIYGSSTTVQPPALTMKFGIYSGVVSKKLWLRTI